MWSTLVQPYPFSDSQKRRWRIVIGMGIFVFLFLFAFRPFGLSRLPKIYLFPILSGYALSCSITLFINLLALPYIFPGIFNEERWTVSREIIFTLFNISCVGFANALFTYWEWNNGFTFSNILNFQLITFMVALFPVVVLVLVKQMTLLKKNLSETKALAESMHHKKRLDIFKEDVITITASNPRDDLKICVNDIVFIQAADNYIEVNYFENKIPKKKLLRSTLKMARNDLGAYTAFYRCHRGWIVNLDKVISITGNSQGYRLIIENSAIQIPVSRNLNLEIAQRLSS